LTTDNEIPQQPEHVRPEQTPKSVADLYRLHGTQVHRWAARLAGPSLESDDIAQEVFMIAHRRMAEFRGEALWSTWLFGITQNVVRHRRRKQRVMNILYGKLANQPEPAPNRPTPIEALEQREATSLVYRALDGMPDRYRVPFVLFEIDGMSGQAISELTGIHPATLRVRLLRARKAFESRVITLKSAEQRAGDRR
jgi:RNA polymerase sigma-70 factor, ECF subfamily